jgi:hypothetical protein
MHASKYLLPFVTLGLAASAHPQEEPDVPPGPGMLISESDLTEDEKRLMLLGSPADSIEEASALGHTVWREAERFVVFPTAWLRTEQRQRHLEVFEAIAKLGAFQAARFGDQPPSLQHLVRQELAKVGVDGGSLAPGDETRFTFSASRTFRLVSNGRRFSTSLLAPTGRDVTASLFASPPLPRKERHNWGGLADYPQPWYMPREAHFTFNSHASEPGAQSAILAFFWRRMAELDEEWAERIDRAKQDAFSKVAGDWPLGEAGERFANQDFGSLPDRVRRALQDDFATNYASYGFSSADEAALYLSRARVEDSPVRLNLVFCSDPKGGKRIGVHMIP